MSDESSRPNVVVLIRGDRGAPPRDDILAALMERFGSSHEVMDLGVPADRPVGGSCALRLRMTTRIPVERVSPDADGARLGKAAKMLVQCDLLDQRHVANGVKAISIALVALWTDDHRARFGDPDHPSTIKRWRTERGRTGRRTLSDMMPIRSGRDRRLLPQDVRGVRERFAREVVVRGLAASTGYAMALQELSRSPREGAGENAFSYSTFCRDCRRLGESIRGTSSDPWRRSSSRTGAGRAAPRDTPARDRASTKS